MKKYRWMKKLTKMMLALLLAFSVIDTTAFQPIYALDANSGSYSKVASDPDTMDSWKRYFESIVNDQGEVLVSTGQAGYIWSDKSVLSYKSDIETEDTVIDDLTWSDENFLVTMSALSANSEIIGYSTIPTDTMLVLDLSNSMTEDNMYAMVKAVNKAIYTLTNLNHYNRVGVAVYATTNSTLLPLDRYTTEAINNNGTPNDASDDYPEYVTLTNFVDNGSTNSGTIDTAKKYIRTDETVVTIDYSDMDWDGLTRAINRAYNNTQKANQLKNYLQDYIPTITDWETVYLNKPDDQTWQEYITSTHPSYIERVDVYESLVSNEDGKVVASVAVGGGTYIQSGLWSAWKQFEAVTDPVVETGILAGTARMPVMVLMSDGAPTYGTEKYNDVAERNNSIAGGSSSNYRVSFVSQLTAAWAKAQMKQKYGSALFYSLGLGVGTNEYATSVLNPIESSEKLNEYWETYLNAGAGTTVTVSETINRYTYTLPVTRDAMVTEQMYVNQYFSANDADSLIGAFDSIVNQIILQSKYYPTLVEDANINMGGFMMFEDVIGEYMEVKDIKGIISGEDDRKLYSGDQFAYAFMNGIFGDIASGDMNKLNDDGKMMAQVLMSRFGISQDQAKTLLSLALTNKQIGYTSATDYSNYLGWYGDENEAYIGFWNGDVNANHPENAKYYIKEYGFLGAVGSEETFDKSNMAYIIVRVATNIETKQQKVTWGVPASLVPVITYSVSFDGSSYDDAKNINMEITEKQPIRLAYEVGVRSDIDEYTINDIVKDYAYSHEDGTYTFFTNMFNYDSVKQEGANVTVTGDPSTHNTTTVEFRPSKDNARYYYTSDTPIYTKNGDEYVLVTGDSVSKSTTYYREVVVFNRYASDGSFKLVRYFSPLSTNILGKVEFNEYGAYIPKGTAFNTITDYESEKDPNHTKTLDYYSHPSMTLNEDGHYAKTYLGNNGKITITPKQGLKLTKEIANVPSGSVTFAFDLTFTNADGTPFNGTLSALFSVENVEKNVEVMDGQLALSLTNGNYVYLTNLPEGVTYRITEQSHYDYKLENVKINDVTVGLTASGTIKNKQIDDVVFVNAAKVPTLTVKKEVTYPFDVTEEQKDLHAFTILVDLGTNYRNQTVKVWGSEDTYTADENGIVTLTLKDDEYVTLILAMNDSYEIYEVVDSLPEGYTWDEANSTNLSGTIQTYDATAVVVNTYAPDEVYPTNVVLNGTKELTGRDWKDTDAFSFVLQYLNGSEWETVEVSALDTAVARKDAVEFFLTNTLQSVGLDGIGTYQFRVLETNGGSVIEGVTYDDIIHTFTIVVTDNDLDGKYEITSVASETCDVTLTNDEYVITVDFVNTYKAKGSATATVKINKDIHNFSDELLSKAGYQFILVDSLGREVSLSTVSNEDGEAEIVLELDISMLGEHQYTLKEVIPTNPIEGVVYDTTEYAITILVKDNLDGTIGAVISVDGVSTDSNEASVTFTNIYDEEILELSGNKVLDGRDWTSEDAFTIELYESAADFVSNLTKLDSEVVTSDSTAFAFDEITYYEPGTYHYVIKEVNAGTRVNGITYDGGYHVTVVVTRNADSSLSKTVTIVDVDTNQVVSNMDVVNTYTVDETSIVIEGTKTLNGRDMQANEFTFALYEANSSYEITNNEPLRTATNADALNGIASSFAFDAITYSGAGTYYYVVKEDTSNAIDGVTFDPTVFKVKVEVVDKGDGTLAATYSVEQGTIAFVNTYTTKPTEHIITGTKVLNGRDMQVNEFTFALYSADEDYNVQGEAIQTTNNVASEDGVVSDFAFNAIEYTTAGTYYYVVKEIGDTTSSGITYDSTIYNVKVVVTDNGNGTLSTSMYVNDSSSQGIAFVNTYTAKPTSAIFNGEKVLSGREWTNDDVFTFSLYETNNDYVVNASSSAIQTKEVTSTNSKFAFDEIAYTEAGTYYYVIKEDHAGETIDGVTYTTRYYKVEVEVTDNGKGQLVSTVTMINDLGESATVATFVNTYEAEKVVTAPIKGYKTLIGRNMDVNEFTFYLYKTGASFKVDANSELVYEVNNVAGIDGVKTEFVFGTLEFDSVGTYYYVAKEKVESADDGITYDKTVYNITVEVTDNGKGQLVAKVLVDDIENKEISFVNKYEVEPTAFSLDGSKTLTGRPLIAGEFSFTLYESDATFVNRDKVMTVTNGANGTFVFEGLKKAPGTYYYIIEEEVGTVGGVTYDASHYHVVVTIADDGEGNTFVKEKLITKYTKSETGDVVTTPNTITFTNSYEPSDEVGLVFSGIKELTGRNPVSGEFTFELYKTGSDYVTNSTPIQTVNDANTFTFEEVYHDAVGTYYYVIKEKPGDKGGVTYDTKEYRIEVVVTDDLHGELVAEIKSIKDADGKAYTSLVFTNTYEIKDEKEAVISGVKSFTGREWKDSDVFTFTLYKTNSSFDVASGVVVETQEATNTKPSFTFETLTFTEVGTHYYAVIENVSNVENGIIYDTKQYNVTIDVTDNGYGKLNLVKTYTVNGTVVSEIKFTNTYQLYENSTAYVDLVANKSLTGRPLKNGEFTFELYEATLVDDKYVKGELVESVTNAGTKVEFSTIEYKSVGTYYYVIKEQKGTLGGVSYDENEYLVAVRVYDDQMGRLATEITYNGVINGEITFENEYTVAPNAFTLDGVKALDGRPLVDGEFTFTLYQSDSNFAKLTKVSTVANADGAFVFENIVAGVGTHYYVIKEDAGTLGGVSYDASEYHITVVIKDNGDGTSSVERKEIVQVKVVDGVVVSEDVQEVVFENTYEAKDTVGLVLEGTKELDTREAINGEFTFELYDADGKLVQSAINKDGKFTFEELKFETTGTYTYTIKEKDLDKDGITYDGTVYTVTITVVDNNQGELVATVSSIVADGKKVDEVVFENEYKIEKPASVVIDGKKTLLYREWLDTDTFTFELYETDKDYVIDADAVLVDSQTVTKGNVEFVFDTITYQTPKTHYYVVKEVKGTIGGITYDETIYKVEVKVKDLLNGTLEVEKTYYKGSSSVSTIEFINQYHIYDSAKAYASLSGIKTLIGRTLKDSEFSFELYSATLTDNGLVKDQLVEKVTNSGSTFNFTRLEFEEVGTYYYMIKETKGSLGGVKYDTKEYPVEIQVTDALDGTLAVKVLVDGKENGTVEFENTYTIYPDTFSFSANKTLTGRELKANEFTFYLYETNSSFTNKELIKEVTNAADGSITFAGLSKLPGTYYYVIEEKVDSLGGITYDSTHYHVTITIEDNGDGTSSITSKKIEKVTTVNGVVSITEASAVEFENTYEAKDNVGLVLEGTKTLVGRDMDDNEFTFELYDVNGKLLQAVTNKDGKFAFEELKFEAVGEYTFTVKEKQGSTNGMTYDSTVYTVVIEVKDNLKGELVATVVSVNGKEQDIAFTNTYEIITNGNVVINGNKTFTGREWTKDDVFTFHLYETDADYKNAKLIDTKTATKDHTAFVFDEITYTKEGTYYYTVSEVVGSDNVGITYDTTVYNVKVEVVDDHKGTLVVTKTYYKGTTQVEDIEFVNTYKVYENAVAKAVIDGIKNLTGRTIKDGEFTFNLYETGSDYVIVEGTDPIQTINDGVNFAFEAITYNKIGTYYYVVKEDRAGETVNGVTYDSNEYKVSVVVYDGGKGYLEAKVLVDGSDNTVLTLNNTYTITPTEFALDGTKELTGRELKANEFTFELYLAKDRTFTNLTLVDTVTNTADGTFTFEGLTQQPGTYYYVIQEASGTLGGVTYDGNKYHVTVVIEDDELGGTKVASISKELVTSSGKEIVNEVVFENSYQAKDTVGLVISGTKVLTGRNLVNGEFIFELLDAEGKVVLQTTVNKDSEFVFDEVFFEETGTYTFTVKEKELTIGGVTFDPTVYTVTVKVTDNLEGELVAVIDSIEDASGKSYTEMVFNNTYKAEPISHVIGGTKVIDGREWLDTDTFTFVLYEANSEFVVAENAQPLDTQVATKAQPEFMFDEITYDKQDTYYYVVKEVVGDIGGITYDETIYHITITVTDMLDGTFSLKQVITVEDVEKDAVVFTNTYKALPTEEGTGIVLNAHKTLNGRPLNDQEFSFDLYETDSTFAVVNEAIQTKTNGIDGTVTFDELGYEEVGTYYYVVLEKVGTLGGITYDEVQYQVTVTVTDNWDGTLSCAVTSIEVNGEAVNAMEFTNTYVPNPTVDGIDLHALKIFKGRDLKANQFSFELYETDSTYTIDAVAIQTKQNDETGLVVFDTLQYDTAGNYYYVIKEIIGRNNNIIYDTSEYHIEVEVRDDLEGQLHASIVSVTKGDEVLTSEDVIFENVYFVDTADDTTSYGWMLSMLLSMIGLVFVSKKRFVK